MRFVLYGLPCAGKTTIFNGLTIQIVHGSTELNRMASGRFSNLPDTEKNALRIRYAEQLKSRLIMQVHDELIVEAPENEKEHVADIVREEMENACKMKVKLTADVHCGRSWYDAKG